MFLNWKTSNTSIDIDVITHQKHYQNKTPLQVCPFPLYPKLNTYSKVIRWHLYTLSGGDVLVFVFVIYLFLTIQIKTLKMLYDKPYRVPFESFLNKKERHICLIILQNEAQWLLAYFFLPKLEVIFKVYPL